MIEGNPFLNRKKFKVKIEGETVFCYVKAIPCGLVKGQCAYLVEVKGKKLLICRGKNGGWYQINYTTPFIAFLGNIIGKHVDEVERRDELRRKAYQEEVRRKEKAQQEEDRYQKMIAERLKNIKEHGSI